jgi:hypothetical protein
MAEREKKTGQIEDIHTRNVDDQLEDELYDDTLYGEIIPSLFAWTSSESQEQRVDFLNEVSEELSKGEKKKGKK